MMQLCAYILVMFTCFCYRASGIQIFLPGGLPLCCTSLPVRARWMLYVRLLRRTELKPLCMYILFASVCSSFREHGIGAIAPGAIPWCVWPCVRGQ